MGAFAAPTCAGLLAWTTRSAFGSSGRTSDLRCRLRRLQTHRGTGIVLGPSISRPPCPLRERLGFERRQRPAGADLHWGAERRQRPDGRVANAGRLTGPQSTQSPGPRAARVTVFGIPDLAAGNSPIANLPVRRPKVAAPTRAASTTSSLRVDPTPGHQPAVNHLPVAKAGHQPAGHRPIWWPTRRTRRPPSRG